MDDEPSCTFIYFNSTDNTTEEKDCNEISEIEEFKELAEPANLTVIFRYRIINNDDVDHTFNVSELLNTSYTNITDEGVLDWIDPTFDTEVIVDLKANTTEVFTFTTNVVIYGCDYCYDSEVEVSNAATLATLVRCPSYTFSASFSYDPETSCDYIGPNSTNATRQEGCKDMVVHSFCPDPIPVAPSDAPSAMPSDPPSDEPSAMPSEPPSDVPSEPPSDVPSEPPSDEPSDVPSAPPSDVPSDPPSDVPSDPPSDVPSSSPTCEEVCPDIDSLKCTFEYYNETDNSTSELNCVEIATVYGNQMIPIDENITVQVKYTYNITNRDDSYPDHDLIIFEQLINELGPVNDTAIQAFIESQSYVTNDTATPSEERTAYRDLIVFPCRNVGVSLPGPSLGAPTPAPQPGDPVLTCPEYEFRVWYAKNVTCKNVKPIPRVGCKDDKNFDCYGYDETDEQCKARRKVTTPLFISHQEEPTSAPSEPPSGVPSDPPSDVPSDPPSDVPSDPPSDVPSEPPSDVPSEPPSDVPSEPPSDMPSEPPTDMPSEPPTDVPSTPPTGIPSFIPSPIPSSPPSDVPSAPPSDVPSDVPSCAPFTVPEYTQFPSVSSRPTSPPAYGKGKGKGSSSSSSSGKGKGKGSGYGSKSHDSKLAKNLDCDQACIGGVKMIKFLYRGTGMHYFGYKQGSITDEYAKSHYADFTLKPYGEADKNPVTAEDVNPDGVLFWSQNDPPYTHGQEKTQLRDVPTPGFDVPLGGYFYITVTRKVQTFTLFYDNYYEETTNYWEFDMSCDTDLLGKYGDRNGSRSSSAKWGSKWGSKWGWSHSKSKSNGWDKPFYPFKVVEIEGFGSEACGLTHTTAPTVSVAPSSSPAPTTECRPTGFFLDEIKQWVHHGTCLLCFPLNPSAQRESSDLVLNFLFG